MYFIGFSFSRHSIVCVTYAEVMDHVFTHAFIVSSSGALVPSISMNMRKAANTSLVRSTHPVIVLVFITDVVKVVGHFVKTDKGVLIRKNYGHVSLKLPLYCQPSNTSILA